LDALRQRTPPTGGPRQRRLRVRESGCRSCLLPKSRPRAMECDRARCRGLAVHLCDPATRTCVQLSQQSRLLTPRKTCESRNYWGRHRLGKRCGVFLGFARVLRAAGSCEKSAPARADVFAVQARALRGTGRAAARPRALPLCTALPRIQPAKLPRIAHTQPTETHQIDWL
jgi:hypothetical protein